MGSSFPWLLALAACLPATQPDRLEVAERLRVAAIKRVAPAVVTVLPVGAAGGGSAVLIRPDGLALTNYHVTLGLGPALRCGMPGGDVLDAVVVGLDPVGDIALIQILGRDRFPCAEWGDSDRVQVADPVLVLGNPLLLANDFQPTITQGIVSGLHRYQYPAGSILEYTDCIQTDAAINPGNSGGALCDGDGKLIGIVGRASFEKRGRISVGVGYAISSRQIQRYLDQLESGWIVDHSTLEATVATDSRGRVVVEAVREDSDAWHQGLRAGDELVEFTGVPVEGVNAFRNILGTYPPGWRVSLTYRRDDTNTHLPRVRLSALHGAEGPRTGDPVPTTHQDFASLPPRVRACYESAPGFANHHFNRVRTAALLRRLRGDAVPPSAPWRAILSDASQSTIELVLADDGSAGQSGTQRFAVGTDPRVPKTRSETVLVFLDHWRRLLLAPERWFGICQHAGGFPGPEGEPCHAIVTNRDGIEIHWRISSETGRLVAAECQFEPGSAWQEWVFREHQVQSGVLVPTRIDGRVAGRPAGEFRLRWTLPGRGD